MKIVFTSTGTSWDDKIDPRFGRAEYLLIFDEESDGQSTLKVYNQFGYQFSVTEYFERWLSL